MGTTIRTFQASDRKAVEYLYREVFGDGAMRLFAARWDWQFHDNPACVSLGPVMWVAEVNEKLVGFLASFTTRFKVFDDVAVLRLPCDLMVSSAVRGKGVGEQLIRAYIETEPRIANALGYSPPAGRMYHRLGYREVDAEPLMMRPYDLRPIFVDIAERRVRSGGLGTLASGVARGFGGLLNPGLRVLNRFRRAHPSARYRVRRCTVAGEDFDKLWRRLAPEFSIAAIRDRKWVQWRFLDDPLFDHALLTAYDDREELVGYVDVRTSDRRGIRFGRILDLFCDPRDSDLVRTLLAAGGTQLESEGVDVVTCLGHVTGIRGEIARYCYYRPSRLQRPAMFLIKGESSSDELAYEAAAWHLTHADGDDGFSP